MPGPIKTRVLRSIVIEGEDGPALQVALNDYYAALADEEFELVAMFQVAEYAVLITYTM